MLDYLLQFLLFDIILILLLRLPSAGKDGDTGKRRLNAIGPPSTSSVLFLVV